MISLIGLIGLLILASITVCEVLLRWLLDFPILFISDVSSLAITVAMASCFPLVFAERRNITIQLVGTLLGPRIHKILQAFGYLVSIGIFSLMTWQLWIYTGDLAASNETTIAVRLSIAPWYRVSTVLVAFCIPVQILVFFDLVKSALTSHGSPDRKAEAQSKGNMKEKGS